MASKKIDDPGRLIGTDPGKAVAELKRAGITASIVKRELPGPLVPLFRLLPPPRRLAAGDHVSVISSGDRVVGLEVDHVAALDDLRQRVERLERGQPGQRAKG